MSAGKKGLKFKQYTNFERLTPQSISKVLERNKPDDLWVVTEKVNGSNFSFATDGTKIEVAKRTSKLDPALDRTFFGFQKVVERYKPNILKCFQGVKEKFKEIDCLWVFGELFGGGYPGVKPIQGIQPVQRGIFYCPDLEFYAFDLSVGDDFLDYDFCQKVFKESGIPFAEPLLIGSFEQAISYPTVFQTTIPLKFGLQPIENNEAEGVVIKRMKRSRPIFKHKNPRFEEISGANRFVRGNSHKRDESFDDICERAKSYVNENRLGSVISKLGEVSLSEKEKLVKLLSDDALVDFCKDELESMGFPRLESIGLWMNHTTKENQDKVKQAIESTSIIVVSSHFRQ